MNIKQFVTGTLVGGIVLYATGFVIWGFLLASFFESNAGSATGVMRDGQVYWAVALGNVALAALLTLTVVGWARAATVVDGIKRGAIVLFLVWLGVDFIQYGFTNLNMLPNTLVDPLLELVHGGVTGGVIVAVTGGAKERAAPSPQ
jgi:hypothetical protein